MTFGIFDILLITIGRTKAAVFFVGLTVGDAAGSVDQQRVGGSGR